MCTVKFSNKFPSGKFLNWGIEQSTKNHEITMKMLVLYEGFKLFGKKYKTGLVTKSNPEFYLRSSGSLLACPHTS